MLFLFVVVVVEKSSILHEGNEVGGENAFQTHGEDNLSQHPAFVSFCLGLSTAGQPRAELIVLWVVWLT